MAQPDRYPARRSLPNDSIAVAGQCAHRLLEFRTHTAETQKQLAKRLRMTESMISRLERGDHIPSLGSASASKIAHHRPRLVQRLKRL